MSPPTHDVTHEDKESTEISRLRNEITNCLRQIKHALLQKNVQRGSVSCFSS